MVEIKTIQNASRALDQDYKTNVFYSYFFMHNVAKSQQFIFDQMDMT